MDDRNRYAFDQACRVRAIRLAARALSDDLAIGGVTFLGGIAFKGHVRKPPFEDDPITVRRSLLQLLDRGADRFFVGHGGPLLAKGVRRYIAHEPRLQPGRRTA